MSENVRERKVRQAGKLHGNLVYAMYSFLTDLKTRKMSFATSFWAEWQDFFQLARVHFISFRDLMFELTFSLIVEKNLVHVCTFFGSVVYAIYSLSPSTPKNIHVLCCAILIITINNVRLESWKKFKLKVKIDITSEETKIVFFLLSLIGNFLETFVQWKKKLF